MEKSLKVTKNGRIEYVDVLKGVGILSVVLLHVYSGYNIAGKPIEYVLKYFTSFHMGLFFFLSGMLFNPYISNYSQRINRKIKTLFLPYLLWDGVIGTGVEFVRCTLGSEGAANYDLKKTIIDFLLGKSTYTGSWFVLTLFLTYMLEYLISFICKKAKLSYDSIPIVILHVLFIPVSLVLNSNAIGDYFRLKLILRACVFFYIGYLFARIKTKIRLNVLVLFLMLAVGMVLSLVFPRVSFSEYTFGNVLYILPSAICTICSLCGLFELLCNKTQLKFLRFIGQYSIIVFYTHLLLMYTVIRMFEKLFHMQIHTFPPLFAFVIIVVLEFVLIKFMPLFLKRLFGIFEDKKAK